MGEREGAPKTDTVRRAGRPLARAAGRAFARRVPATIGFLSTLALSGHCLARAEVPLDGAVASAGAATFVPSSSGPVPVPASFDPVFRVARPFSSAGSGLELRPLFGTLDGALFRERVTLSGGAGAGLPFALDGIGFPGVEVVPAPTRRHQRRFVRLLDWHTVQGARGPLARVRCMNLPSHVVAARAARWRETIDALAADHGLAPSLVMAVVARESCFDPDARSRAGAIGLMQLMPATARELRAGNVRNPFLNLSAGVRYLADMHAMFGSVELALAAYNAGPGSVRRYGGIPPFAETRAYVERVLAYERRYRALELVASL